MPISTNSDAELIESAYEDEVGLLFKQFFISLTGEKGTTNDDKWLAAFKLGLNTLKRAKGLALGAVGSSAPATPADVAHRALVAMTNDAAIKPSRRKTRDDRQPFRRRKRQRTLKRRPPV